MSANSHILRQLEAMLENEGKRIAGEKLKDIGFNLLQIARKCKNEPRKKAYMAVYNQLCEIVRSLPIQ